MLLINYWLVNRGVDTVAAAEEDAGTTASATMFNGGPKLEDFLGGGSSTTADQAEAGGLPQQLPHQTQTQTQTPVTHGVSDSSTEIYDSDLKTLAASFLRGFSSEQTDTHKKQQQHVPTPTAEPAAPRRAVDTFGQRTSIYRGVTR